MSAGARTRLRAWPHPAGSNNLPVDAQVPGAWQPRIARQPQRDRRDQRARACCGSDNRSGALVCSRPPAFDRPRVQFHLQAAVRVGVGAAPHAAHLAG
eukprot:4460151-Prymnesium_polylepis.1